MVDPRRVHCTHRLINDWNLFDTSHASGPLNFPGTVTPRFYSPKGGVLHYKHWSDYSILVHLWDVEVFK